MIGLPEKSQAQERAKHARASNVPGEIGPSDANEMGGSSSIVPPNFLAWLREQAKSGGAIGEPSKAARRDPLFPKVASWRRRGEAGRKPASLVVQTPVGSRR